MIALYPKTKEAIVQELGERLFYVGKGEYKTREDYLSGDVKTKLSEVTVKQEFSAEGRNWKKNIEALEAVQPKDITISQLNYKFGTRFIPTHIYEAFLVEALGQSPNFSDAVNVEYDSLSDSYQVSIRYRQSDANAHQYAVGKVEGVQLAQNLLNQKTLEIKVPDPTAPEGTKPKMVVDHEATTELQAKGEQLSNAFKEWVLKNSPMQEEIISLYNEKMNRIVPKQYDGSSLTVNGLSKQFTLRPHQKNAIMRIVQDQRAGIFHEVGSGKTLTLLAANIKLKELGIIQKPMFVVPKPLIDQFGREIYQYFPESKVLIAQSEDFDKEHRKRFVSRIATGNYDFIVIADSQFGKVGMSKAYQERYIQQEINKADLQMAQAKDNGQKYTVKKAEQFRAACQERLKKLQKSDTDTFIDFESLGIDMLNVDEAQGYKNLAPQTQLEGVKGISDARSQKAMDMDQKVQYLHSQYNNRRVVFSTGTPISNSVVELYTMMKYLSPEILEKHGVASFDSWTSDFGTIESVFELNVAGNYKVKRRFTKFGNMPELRNLFLEVADIQTAEDLDLPVPEAETIIHQSSTTPAQVNYIESLVKRAEAIEAGEVKPWEDNMLKILSENKKLTIDMRMLDDVQFSEEDSEKINQVVESVYKIWEETKAQRSTQMIFSDSGVPLKYKNKSSKNLDKSQNNFSAYDEIKRQLVAKGVPDSEVRFIHEATDATREQMMRDMRSGKIRILLASTSKGGTGRNVQDKLKAVHHLDVPWKPSDSTQRNGRIIRQGNENDDVQIHIYITKGSMDSFMWQTQENKKYVVDQLMSGHSDVREIDEMDNAFGPSVYKAIATDDPVKAEYMQLEMQVDALFSARNRFYESKAAEEKRIEKEREKLPALEQRVPLVKQDIERLAQNKDADFEMTLFQNGREKHYDSEDKKKEVAELFNRLVTQNATEEVQLTKIAEYRGFEIFHQSHGRSSQGELFELGGEEFLFKGATSYHAQLTLTSLLGTLAKINHYLDKLRDDLYKTTQEIERIQTGITRIEQERKVPFPREKEFIEKKQRLQELRRQLNDIPELTPDEKSETSFSLHNDFHKISGTVQGQELEELEGYDSDFLKNFDLSLLSDSELAVLTFNLIIDYQSSLASQSNILPEDWNALKDEFEYETQAYLQLRNEWKQRGKDVPIRLKGVTQEPLEQFKRQVYDFLKEGKVLPAIQDSQEKERQRNYSL
ncbi:helicase-related protein [Lactococcus nasutitermitis]|uniref:Helicase-related protein n=1 Tax=Lactococcus nasutitermitis TaxID=1652957 RepID=A0ABV9JGJ5_9LACT|nr:SNF2-related protein [Lactococcus nasutitermitis]